MNFIEALAVADRVFAQYRVDYPKWWRRMDGTPILNDVSVRMAQAFVDEWNTRTPSPSPATMGEEGKQT